MLNAHLACKGAGSAFPGRAGRAFGWGWPHQPSQAWCCLLLLHVWQSASHVWCHLLRVATLHVWQSCMYGSQPVMHGVVSMSCLWQ